jgi:hypothetical protein
MMRGKIFEVRADWGEQCTDGGTGKCQNSSFRCGGQNSTEWQIYVGSCYAMPSCYAMMKHIDTH